MAIHLDGSTFGTNNGTTDLIEMSRDLYHKEVTFRSRNLLSRVGHERESTAKHGTSGNSTTPHAGRDTARHHTALRRAVELAKLNGAGDTVCFFVLSAIRSWV